MVFGHETGKQFRETEVATKCTIHDDGGATYLAPGSAPKEKTRLVGRSTMRPHGYFFSASEESEVAVTSARLINNRATLLDANDEPIAVMKVASLRGPLRGTDEINLFRMMPSYEGQASISLDHKNPHSAPTGEDADTPLYNFARIVTKRNFVTATSTYAAITGRDADGEPTYEELYVAEKIATVRFQVYIKTSSDGAVAAKVYQSPSIKFPTVIEASEGADLPIVALLAQAVGPDGVVGALAGGSAI